MVFMVPLIPISTMRLWDHYFCFSAILHKNSERKSQINENEILAKCYHLKSTKKAEEINILRPPPCQESMLGSSEKRYMGKASFAVQKSKGSLKILRSSIIISDLQLIMKSGNLLKEGKTLMKRSTLLPQQLQQSRLKDKMSTSQQMAAAVRGADGGRTLLLVLRS